MSKKWIRISKKWVGKYFISIIEAQGEGPYNAVIELSIEENRDAHFHLYYQELNHTEIEGGTKIYGSFINIDNDVIQFEPQVMYEGQDSGRNMDFKLHLKDGKYYIETDLLVPETIDGDLIPIRKIE